MTTAKPPARYSAMESARSGDFATPELHHPSGHDLSSVTIYLDRNYQTPDGPRSYLGINDWQDSFSDGGASFHQSITSMSGGTYNISFVDVTDKAGNERFYYPGELQALGFRTSFEVTGGSPDTTKPQLTSLALPTTIDVSSGSGALDASVGASDVGAGVSSVTVYLDRNYQTPDGPRSYLGINDWQDSFSDGGASFHQSITSMSGGTYNISFVDVTDKAGNERFYYPGELQALGFRTSFEVTGGSPDTTKPQLTSLALPTTIDVSSGSGALDASVGASDVGAGVSSVTVYLDRNYQTPDGPRSYLGINDWQDSFSDGGASFHQSITSMSGGTYNISFVDVTDKAGNERFYYPGELQALGFRTSFEVTGGSPDTTKPQLTSLALPTTIDVSSGSGALDASVGASDVGAGVS